MPRRYLSTLSARSVLILMMAHVANNFLAWRNHLQEDFEMSDHTYNYIFNYVFYQLVYFVVLWSLHVLISPLPSAQAAIASEDTCRPGVFRLRLPMEPKGWIKHGVL